MSRQYCFLITNYINTSAWLSVKNAFHFCVILAKSSHLYSIVITNEIGNKQHYLISYACSLELRCLIFCSLFSKGLFICTRWACPVDRADSVIFSTLCSYGDQGCPREQRARGAAAPWLRRLCMQAEKLFIGVMCVQASDFSCLKYCFYVIKSFEMLK
jgi:hypothetical protein